MELITHDQIKFNDGFIKPPLWLAWVSNYWRGENVIIIFAKWGEHAMETLSVLLAICLIIWISDISQYTVKPLA